MRACRNPVKGWVRSIRDVVRCQGGASLVDGQGRLIGVGLEHALERRPGSLPPERLGELEPAVEVAADGRGVEGRPVLERHLLAELERVGAAFVAGGPLGGQQRRGLSRGLVHADQSLQDLAGDPVGLDIGDHGRIQPERLGGGAEVEHRAGGGVRGAGRGGGGARAGAGGSGAGGERQRQEHGTRRPQCGALRRSAFHWPRTAGLQSAAAQGAAGHCTSGHSVITSGDWMDRRLRNSLILVDPPGR